MCRAGSKLCWSSRPLGDWLGSTAAGKLFWLDGSENIAIPQALFAPKNGLRISKYPTAHRKIVFLETN
jgi:hypothetical protein